MCKYVFLSLSLSLSLTESLSSFPIIPHPYAPPHTILISEDVLLSLSFRFIFSQTVHIGFGVGSRERVTYRVGVSRHCHGGERTWLTYGEWNEDLWLLGLALHIQEVARVEGIWLLKVAWVMEGRAQDGVHSNALRGHQRQMGPNGHQQRVAESSADKELHLLCGSTVGGRNVEIILPYLVYSVPSLQVSSPTTLIPHPQDPWVFFMICRLKGSHLTQQSPIRSWLQDWGPNIIRWVLFIRQIDTLYQLDTPISGVSRYTWSPRYLGDTPRNTNTQQDNQE